MGDGVPIEAEDVTAVFYVSGKDCEQISMPGFSPGIAYLSSMVSYRHAHLRFKDGKPTEYDISIHVERRMTKEEEAKYGTSRSERRSSSS